MCISNKKQKQKHTKKKKKKKKWAWDAYSFLFNNCNIAPQAQAIYNGCLQFLTVHVYIVIYTFLFYLKCSSDLVVVGGKFVLCSVFVFQPVCIFHCERRWTSV